MYEHNVQVGTEHRKVVGSLLGASPAAQWYPITPQIFTRIVLQPAGLIRTNDGAGKL